MQLYMSIPDRINFLQMGRYGKFSEQTYRNNFEKAGFDWFAFNAHLASKILSGKRKAIAIDPSHLMLTTRIAWHLKRFRLQTPSPWTIWTRILLSGMWPFC